MNWEYFILFAIAALVCWALGAFAAWKGTKPGWAYGFTFLGCTRKKEVFASLFCWFTAD